MRVHAEPKPLTGPLPGGREGATVVVEPLKAGEVQTPRAFLERAGGRFEALKTIGIGTPRSQYLWVPCAAFLIHHPSVGAVLVDTGLHPSVESAPVANLGRL